MPFFSTMLAAALPALIQGGMGMIGGNKNSGGMAGIPAPGGQQQQQAPIQGPPMPENIAMGAQVGKGLGSFGGRMIGSLANRAAGAMGDRLFEKSENQAALRNAKAMGKQQKAQADAAHPGTNPWEQLGQGGMSATTSMASTKANNRQADKMQEKDLANKVQVATIAANPGNVQAATAQQRLPSEITRNLNAAALNLIQAERTGVQTSIDRSYAEFASLQAEVNVWAKATGSPTTALANVAKGLKGPALALWKKMQRGISNFNKKYPKPPAAKRKLTRSGKPRNYPKGDKFIQPGM